MHVFVFMTDYFCVPLSNIPTHFNVLRLLGRRQLVTRP